ncbi:replication initiation and membrane attachment family protein [Bacillus sp. 31A1R]|uniref:Replication initiation and membrane attachment family protein n=1 Tax=Robertmurraya mangrovi TaxID=3098077 RepID=A0ABU5IZ69_9BACI|nr:replication initiation and membrane attachment family protein [Bacillus sp. 31A1R]MDZ5472469.1 replication initiation and membrane attachment family protein [Bacillus sp. 31A1R]
MVQHWQEMLPIDRYVASSNGLLYEYDRKILTFLYQPLIGPTSLSLYFTLWAQVEENRLWSESSSHHGLMNIMGLNLNDIYQARLKLEGIGLIKTLVRVEDGTRSFIYELQPPLTPDQFFLDGMLNIYLYRKIGKNQYLKLKRFFSDKAVQAEERYENITRAFQDIYETATPTTFQFSEDAENIQQEEGQVFVGRNHSTSIQVDETGFDFDLLLAGLTEALVPRNSLTKKVREAISNLSFLYGIDPIQMKNLVLSSLDADDKINIEDLRKAARDWFQFENQDQLPLLIDKIQPPMNQSKTREPKTQEEQLIHYLDTTSPRQLLIDISGGGEASKSDLQIIEDVMFQQKLLPGVVNVLIQYVLLKTDMKLTKGYVEKIASHWARKKIKTVKEAMELAKKEHRQYLDWAEGKTAKTPGKKKPIRTEALPDWFDHEQENKPNVTNETEKTEDYEAKKRALEERLKKYKS